MGGGGGGGAGGRERDVCESINLMCVRNRRREN